MTRCAHSCSVIIFSLKPQNDNRNNLGLLRCPIVPYKGWTLVVLPYLRQWIPLCFMLERIPWGWTIGRVWCKGVHVQAGEFTVANNTIQPARESMKCSIRAVHPLRRRTGTGFPQEAHKVDG